MNAIPISRCRTLISAGVACLFGLSATAFAQTKEIKNGFVLRLAGGTATISNQCTH